MGAAAAGRGALCGGSSGARLASERISPALTRRNSPPARVAIALRGPRGVCGDVNVKTIGCCTPTFPAL
eukprot:4407788-Prymnesium_polylepis.1